MVLVHPALQLLELGQAVLDSNLRLSDLAQNPMGLATGGFDYPLGLPAREYNGCDDRQGYGEQRRCNFHDPHFFFSRWDKSLSLKRPDFYDFQGGGSLKVFRLIVAFVINITNNPLDKPREGCGAPSRTGEPPATLDPRNRGTSHGKERGFVINITTDRGANHE
jgi:hypothetical protein